MSYGDVKSSYGGAGRWGRSGCAKGAPRSAKRQGEEQHRHTERGSHTRRDKGKHSRQGGGAQQGRRGNQNSGDREPEWRGWESVRMGGSDNEGDGLASQPCRYRVPGQPLLNRHQVGGVSRSPDGLFAQQEREPIRGRPAVKGKRTYGGRLGQRVEEQGTWASRTQNHSEEGYGWPVDRGAWTTKTVKRPRQQPAQPQYANYWAPLTRKRHTMPHSAQPQHTNYWALRLRKRHQQEHRPQRPTESSNPTQHVKGRTGDCPGPRKGTTTRRNVTQGDFGGSRVGNFAFQTGLENFPYKIHGLPRNWHPWLSSTQIYHTKCRGFREICLGTESPPPQRTPDSPTSHSVLAELPHAHIIIFIKAPKKPPRRKNDTEKLANTHPARTSMHLTLGPIAIVSAKLQGPPEPHQRKSLKTFSPLPPVAPNDVFFVFQAALMPLIAEFFNTRLNSPFCSCLTHIFSVY